MKNVAAKRRALMARVRHQDTKPELIVRSFLHRSGMRFRLHRSDLPGTPDIVFPALRKIILVHGCFWHRHKGCARTTSPKTRNSFWLAKFEANIARDRRVQRHLRKLGWRILIVWECETRNENGLKRKLQRFLSEELKDP
jgi:DNA mismatch endonuclease (patch repair protein)